VKLIGFARVLAARREADAVQTFQVVRIEQVKLGMLWEQERAVTDRGARIPQ
jgi:hypothetical protein